MIFGERRVDKDTNRRLKKVAKENLRAERERDKIKKKFDKHLFREVLPYAWLPKKLWDGRWIWLEFYEPYVKVRATFDNHLRPSSDRKLYMECKVVYKVKDFSHGIHFLNADWFLDRTINDYTSKMNGVITFEVGAYLPKGE